MDRVLRVVVVDDSAYVRKVVKQRLSRSPFLEVVGMARDGVEALDAGAVDFVQKPTALATEKLLEISNELIEKVKTAASVPLARLRPPVPRAVVIPPKNVDSFASAIDLIVMGVSTGGPQALKYLIPQLPESFPVPVAIVMNMPVGYTGNVRPQVG